MGVVLAMYFDCGMYFYALDKCVFTKKTVFLSDLVLHIHWFISKSFYLGLSPFPVIVEMKVYRDSLLKM